MCVCDCVCECVCKFVCDCVCDCLTDLSNSVGTEGTPQHNTEKQGGIVLSCLRQMVISWRQLSDNRGEMKWLHLKNNFKKILAMFAGIGRTVPLTTMSCLTSSLTSSMTFKG